MNLHAGYETMNAGMDVVLLITSFYMAYTVNQINLGGAVGKTIRWVVYGAVVLGLAHLAETVLSDVFNVPHSLNELIHRGIVFIGFILLTMGLRSLGHAFGRFKKK